jgi:hypothetical protein
VGRNERLRLPSLPVSRSAPTCNAVNWLKDGRSIYNLFLTANENLVKGLSRPGHGWHKKGAEPADRIA